MGQLLHYLKSKTFIINLLIGIVITGGGIFWALDFLHTYTKHGEQITVPDMIGFKIDELDEFIIENKLNYIILDSVYDAKRPKGTVVAQDPLPNSFVKENRKIYLTVNAKKPPMIKLPELKDLSIRQATAKLEAYGFKLGQLISRPSLCSNCAIGMQFKGEEVAAGDAFSKNTMIDIIVGVGNTGEKIEVPLLLNETHENVIKLLKLYSINLSATVYQDCQNADDSTKAKVFKQNPTFDDPNGIAIGGSIDIWLTVDSIKLINSLPQDLFVQPDSTSVNE
jgi:eukaryotic-like serine/threonine-protein kinase